MSTISKPLSKTVQQRQLKRMKPRHYEILLRLLNGQSQKKIASEMGLGEQRLSVIINSPVFHEELRKRWEVREQAIIQRFKEREERRIEAATAMMRDGLGDPSILEEPSVVDGSASDGGSGTRIKTGLENLSSESWPKKKEQALLRPRGVSLSVALDTCDSFTGSKKAKTGEQLPLIETI